MPTQNNNMEVIVEISGKQFRVKKDDKIVVPKIEGEKGDKIILNNVLMSKVKDKINFGKPIINNIDVKCEIIKHFKGEKKIIFKKKRRKGYKVKNGYRDALTEILISSIGKEETKKTTSKKKEETKKTVSKKKDETKKTVSKKKDETKK